MIVKIDLERQDLDVLHDIVMSVTGGDIYIDSELVELWNILPEEIRNSAVHWGTNDSVVRDNIYNFLENYLSK